MRSLSILTRNRNEVIILLSWAEGRKKACGLVVFDVVATEENVFYLGPDKV